MASACRRHPPPAAARACAPDTRTHVHAMLVDPTGCPCSHPPHSPTPHYPVLASTPPTLPGPGVHFVHSAHSCTGCVGTHACGCMCVRTTSNTSPPARRHSHVATRCMHTHAMLVDPTAPALKLPHSPFPLPSLCLPTPHSPTTPHYPVLASSLLLLLLSCSLMCFPLPPLQLHRAPAVRAHTFMCVQ